MKRGTSIVSLAVLCALAPCFAVEAGPAEGPPSIPAEGPAVVKARTAALLMSDMAGGAVRTSVLALPRSGPQGEPESGAAGRLRRPVWVKVEIDAADLVEEPAGTEPVAQVDRTAPIPVEVFLYALGRDREVRDAFTVRFVLDEAVIPELRAGRGLAVAAVLELPPGDSRLRHLVWSESPHGGQRFGLGTTTVTVPSSDPPTLVWIPERPGRWLWVTPAEEWLPEDPAPASLPVVSSAGGTEATVVAWWRLHEPRESEVAAGRLSASSHGGTVRLESDGSASRFEAPFEVLDRRPDAAGGELVQVRFPAPEVEPGRYRLSLHPRDGLATLPLPVVVAHPEAGEIWPRVLPAVREPDDPVPGEPDDHPAAPEAIRKRAVAESDASDRDASDRDAVIRRDYRAAVARLAADPDAAAAELARREAEVLRDLNGGDPGPVLARLVEIQRGTAAELLGPEADGALALALLHAAVARHHYRTGRWPLADRAVEQAVWLAEGHAAIRDTREARRDAAGLLAWLAADLRQAGRGSKARQMFRRSLAREETDAALLGLATLEERAGATAEAVAVLERLLARNPEHAEGRLRLAVNLARGGNTDRARDLLRRLVRTVSTRWVAVVAYQQLARIELDRGDCAGAVRVLHRARDRFPDQPQIAVQLAWALECAGESAVAREITERIVEEARRGTNDGVCPRTRYTRWSDEELAPERRRLGELAQASRQALTRHMDGFGAGR